MHITGDALAAYATDAEADLLITGHAPDIIATLMHEELGDCINNIGDVVAVKMTLQELATLASSSAAENILIVQLNRNARRKTTWTPGLGKPYGEIGQGNYSEDELKT